MCFQDSAQSLAKKNMSQYPSYSFFSHHVPTELDFSFSILLNPVSLDNCENNWLIQAYTTVESKKNEWKKKLHEWLTMTLINSNFHFAILLCNCSLPNPSWTNELQRLELGGKRKRGMGGGEGRDNLPVSQWQYNLKAPRKL